MTLYDLAGQNDDLRFSPYCWRVKMALVHKGLDVDSKPWRFTEKETLAFSEQGKVPVLVDGDQVVTDSWAILNYLDSAYSDRPLLFADEAAKQSAFNLKEWVEKTLLLPLLKMTILDIYNGLHEKDKVYFRESREKRLGMSLESFCDPSEDAVIAFRQLLEPVRNTLEWQPFLSGTTAGGADYILFGALQWIYCTSSIALLEDDDPVNQWCQRIRALFNGFGEKVTRAV